MSNILIIKHGSLGDIVQISGVLRDIRENNKDKKIFKNNNKPIPQVKKLPIVTGEPSSLLIFGWLPEPSQDAYQQGLGGMLGGRLSPEQWAENVQKAWEQDLETLNVNRSDLL